MVDKKKSDAFGNFKGGSPNKKLSGPVGKDSKTKKGAKPDRPLVGPVGMIFPIPKKGAPKKGKAAPKKNA